MHKHTHNNFLSNNGLRKRPSYYKFTKHAAKRITTKMDFKFDNN